MTKSAQIILGITIAAIGATGFFQRAYFAEVFLGASAPTADTLLQLGSGLGDPAAQNQIADNEFKQNVVAIAGGTLFLAGAVFAIGVAADRQTQSGQPN